MYKIGIIGVGNMGEAILKSLIERGILDKSEITIFDINPDKLSYIVSKYNVSYANSEEELVKNSKYIFLVVKPQDYKTVLEKIKNSFTKEKVLISVLAGVKIKKIEEILGEVSIVRIMPNTPVIVGEGAVGVSFNSQVKKEDIEMLKIIFDKLGETVYVKEELLDAVTGLSGSGPAYVFVFIDALAQGGVKMGLSYNDALKLAVQTVLGSARMLKEFKEHPSVLRDRVTSPAGTTIYGLSTLESKGFRDAIMSAVESATNRSKDIE